MKIKLLPTGQEIEADPNKSLLQLCTENQVEIRSICKGIPSCAECRVRIVEGEHNVLPPTKAEIGVIGSNYFIDQRRLACQVRCFGNITVDLTEQIERVDTQSKKVRGFRAANQKGVVETHAKQGTLILEEVPAYIPAKAATPSQQQDGPSQQQQRSSGQGQPQRHGGGGRQQGNRGHGGDNQNRGQQNRQQAQGQGEQQKRNQQSRQGGNRDGGGNRGENRNNHGNDNRQDSRQDNRNNKRDDRR